MATSQTTQFNKTCVALSAVFFIGIIFQWRAVEPAVSLEVDAREDVVENVVTVEVPQPDDVVVENKKKEVNKITKQTDPVPAAQPAPALPTHVNLNVPFTSQAPEANWDQPWQDACEEAAVLMLDAYYKEYGVSPFFARDEILKMVAWEEKKKWGRSIEIEKVKALTAWYMGKQITNNKQQITIVNDPTVDDIKQSIANGHPVLAVAYGKELPNPNFRSGGPEYHALIIRGYTQTHFITNDPGTRNGKNFEYEYKDLMNALRDWNGGEVKKGKPVVLVVK